MSYYLFVLFFFLSPVLCPFFLFLPLVSFLFVWKQVLQRSPSLHLPHYTPLFLVFSNTIAQVLTESGLSSVSSVAQSEPTDNLLSSVAQSCLTLQPHGLQHARLSCPSQLPRAFSNSCPSSRWCHPTISSSVVPFSSCLQYFPASGSFPMSQFFASGGQSIGASASASVLPMNIQDWFPLGWTGWISSHSKRLSRVFSNTTVQKHQFFRAQLCL